MVNSPSSRESIRPGSAASTLAELQLPGELLPDNYATNEQLRRRHFLASYAAHAPGYNAHWYSGSQWQLRHHPPTITDPLESRDPPPYTRPLPVQPQHRVYILRCAHCDTFLSDRGMRAVLLLRPHITLFSTDTSPSSCGALYSSVDEQPNSEQEQVERTCDCLTQSLGCFCCGNVVGYEIIIPCTRCTGSANRTSQRSSNGHRYVFHHNEVTYSERKYRQGESGIAREYSRSHQSYTSSTFRTAGPLPRPGGRLFEPDSKDVHLSVSPSTLLHASRAPSPFPTARHLQDGETVYWHHLVPAGELQCSMDPRLAPLTVPVAGR